MNHYEAKQAACGARLEARGMKSEKQADGLNDRAEKMTDAIPCGHHSEGRDRRYHARIFKRYEKVYALQEEARAYRDKADLAELKASQEKMRTANRLIRWRDRTGLAQLGFPALYIETLFMPVCGRLGFPDYELKSNAANIRCIKLRIAESEKRKQRCDRELQGHHYTYRETQEITAFCSFSLVSQMMRPVVC